MAPVPRPTARVMPVTDVGEVLLLTIADTQGEPALMTFGWGLEPGEDVTSAAGRELAEEVELVVDPQALVGPIHRGTHEWTSEDAVDQVSESAWFALSVDSFEVSGAGRRPDGLGFITAHTWVTPEALVGDPWLRHPLLPQIAVLAVEAAW